MNTTVNCHDVELDNGETLADLGIGNYLELDQTVAGMAPGTWVLVAYEGDHGIRERAQMHQLTREEIQAARRGEAFAQIHA